MSSDSAFTGSIPDIYDRSLGPLLFNAYGEALAKRVAPWDPADLLETAAGTGIATQALASALPDCRIVATDLNPAMLEVARRRLGDRIVTTPADAQALPFEAESFDVVACQFGVMFYPDRVRGHAEARRVLRPGGRYLFVVWDRLDANPVAAAVQEAMDALFPADPPRFLERTPFGYWDAAALEADCRAAGFETVVVERVAARSEAISARDAAYGLTQGSPLKADIEARDPSRLDEATEGAARIIAERCGAELGGTALSALFVTAT